MGFQTHNGLTEVFAHGRVSKGGEVDAVEVLLVPEVHLRHIDNGDEGHVELFHEIHEYRNTFRCQQTKAKIFKVGKPHELFTFNDSTHLVELLHVESFVGEWCNVKITPENCAILESRLFFAQNLLNC